MVAVIGRALKVVLPEGEDERILRCAQRLSEAGLASPVLLLFAQGEFWTVALVALACVSPRLRAVSARTSEC